MSDNCFHIVILQFNNFICAIHDRPIFVRKSHDLQDMLNDVCEKAYMHSETIIQASGSDMYTCVHVLSWLVEETLRCANCDMM